MTSSEITAVQSRLTELGFPTSADGLMGPATQASVKAFQAAKGLKADGVVGPLTIAALGLTAVLASVSTAPSSASVLADREAYQVALRADPSIPEAVRQYCLAVSRGEGGYGRSWGTPSAATIAKSQSVGLTGYEGKGSNNWGAIQGTGSAGSFPHIDHDAQRKMYVANYKRYKTPEEGYLDVCRVVTKGGLRGATGATELQAALEQGNLSRAVKVQHANGYFELAPDLYLATLVKNYQALAAATGWTSVLSADGLRTGIGLGTALTLGALGFWFSKRKK